MGPIDAIGNKTGGLGAIVSAMGCGACFPAFASFGSAIGLGFLSQWHRSVLGMVGPLIVLVATFTMAEKLLYVGLAAMVAVSIWDFVSPASQRCGPDGRELPAKRA